MIRLVRMGSDWYGLELPSIDDNEMENIEAFVEAGETVVFCYDLEDAKQHLGIENIEMVEV